MKIFEVTEGKIRTRKKQCERGQKKKKPRTDCRGQQRSEMMKEDTTLQRKKVRKTKTGTWLNKKILWEEVNFGHR